VHLRRRALLNGRDYLLFVRMMLNRGKANGGQVLKAETVHPMSRFVTADPGSILLGA
jgi:hypothetical protein